MSDDTTADLSAAGPIVPERMRLLVLAGPDRGRSLELERGTYLVGKDPRCGLCLTDGAVSRTHLELRVEQAGVIVRDLGSRNGTFLEGARITEVLVGVGAVIGLGETKLKLVLPGALLEPPVSNAESFGRLVGKSLAMRRVYAVLERVAASDVSVLIEGETGCGKELCADAIHSHSARRQGPLVVCDLSSVTRSLIESELFGHKKGAFTGAHDHRNGAFVQAHGGTLFLDELGELDLEMQPRLLRALESKAVKPVGGGQYVQVDTRVIAATNRDLREETEAGRFRKDLYHRLAVVHVHLPPLRERKEDLPELIDQLLLGRGVEVPAESRAMLQEYDWPGNVRELRNVLDRALALMGPNDAQVLTPELLGLSAAPQGEPVTGDLNFHESKERLVSAWERRYLHELLRQAGGNVTRAAQKGGLERGYLHRLLKKHGLN